MDRRAKILVGLVVGLAAFSFTEAVADGSAATTTTTTTTAVTNSPAAKQVSLSGTVVARYGSTVVVKTDNGQLYGVNAQNAAVTLDGIPGNGMSLRVSDRVKVDGFDIGSNNVNAIKVQVTLTPSEAATMRPSAASGVGAGPSSVEDVQLPSVGDSLGSWRSRGLVVNARYRDRVLTIATSTGTFTIDARDATIAKGSRSVSIAEISEGDVVRIWGDLSGLNRVLADRVEVIQSKHQLDAAVPLTRASVKGVITNIDFASATFRMNTGANDLRILADENTFIHLGFARKAFQDLAIGQTVKVVGVGSLGTGFVASEIMIVGAPGN